MKIKPSRDLQLIVAITSFPAAVATAAAGPDGWVKWLVVAVLAIGGGIAEWMIERACSKAAKFTS
jgi:hypothetical protein